MTLDHLFIPESKTAITDYRDCARRTQEPILKDQTWDNLRISKDKNCNGLNHSKYV